MMATAIPAWLEFKDEYLLCEQFHPWLQCFRAATVKERYRELHHHLLRRVEDDADRCLGVYFLARQRQLTVGLVTLEFHHHILFLQAGEQKLSRGIDTETADGGPARRCVLNFGQ